MNKENYDPNVCTLKRREAHLSVSRSIPSIFRRRKRARSTQLGLCNEQIATTKSTTLRATNSQKQAPSCQATQTTRPTVESVNQHQRSTFEHIKQSMSCKSKCAASHSLSDHQGDGELNKEGNSVSSKDLRDNEDQNRTFSQEIEGRTIRSGDIVAARVKVMEQRNAIELKHYTRDSQNFAEDISKDVAQESDHSVVQRRPESHVCKAFSQRQM